MKSKAELLEGVRIIAQEALRTTDLVAWEKKLNVIALAHMRLEFSLMIQDLTEEEVREFELLFWSIDRTISTSGYISVRELRKEI